MKRWAVRTNSRIPAAAPPDIGTSMAVTESKSPSTADLAIIGGGIVGLATALAALQRHPRLRLTVLEKEPRWAAHQSGRNSNVIHSGLYYRPGSARARLAVAGNRSMYEFCSEQHLPFARCGKLIVATDESELSGLEALQERAAANGVVVELLTAAGAEEREPNVRAVAALGVESAGVTDYGAVCRRMAELIAGAGGQLLLNHRVEQVRRSGRSYALLTSGGLVRAQHLVACAGLDSDRVAWLEGIDPGVRIVPFRGEYFEVRRPELVRALVYPVPNPELPFLGVHLTRMIDGALHAGPNAVLAFKREGYRKTDLSVRDLASTLAFPGFWRMARRFARSGGDEMRRSISRRAFLRSLQQLVPSIREEDLQVSPAGVRAQAVRPDGSLEDDFLFVRGEASLHVCNAPSPAATASLEIGKVIAEKLEGILGR